MLLFIDFCACPWWLPWLLPFLLGLLLGWLIWGRLKGRIAELEAENAKLKAKINGLEGDLADCNTGKAGLDSKIALLSGRIKELTAAQMAVSDVPEVVPIISDTPKTPPEVSDVNPLVSETPPGATDINPLAAGLSAASVAANPLVSVPPGSPGKKDPFAALKPENLQVVEGIGPKMNEVLNNNGVTTWSDLGAKTGAEIRAILDSVNAARYRIIDPSTWPEQARLADSGKWDDLIQMQKNLNTGRAEGATGQTDSKVEKLLIKMGVLKRWKKDDLTAVEGIGPKISGLLRNAGITTWRALENTEVSAIQAILDAAGKRFTLADPGSWPKQAGMAADGRWDDLEEYQDFLQGGK